MLDSKSSVNYKTQSYDTIHKNVPLALSNNQKDLVLYSNVTPTIFNRKFYEMAQFLAVDDVSQYFQEIFKPHNICFDTIQYLFSYQKHVNSSPFNMDIPKKHYHIFKLVYDYGSITSSQFLREVLQNKMEQLWMQLLHEYSDFEDPPSSVFGAYSVLAFSHYISDKAMHQTLDFLIGRGERANSNRLRPTRSRTIIGYSELDLPPEDSAIYERLYQNGFKHSAWRSPLVWCVVFGVLLWIHIAVGYTILQGMF